MKKGERRGIVLSIVVLYLLCVVPVRSVLFYLNEGETKCFLEEVPEHTLMLVNFNAEDVRNTGSPLGITVSVQEPNSGAVNYQTFGLVNKYAFTSEHNGEYKICIGSNSSSWFGTGARLEVHLDIESGAAATDYSAVAKADHLSSMELEIKKMVDLAEEVMNEQNYQRGREVEFEDVVFTTNSRVHWWSVIQTILFIVSAVWQIRYLRSYFQKKKLI
eukprot:TRINITY_DN1896_c0_g1_i1.p1 TRINITY_DN1896_c0_g1~~TRINITY_DN1896_c0_g1_i1.p1  ORF type:complete len:217 (-),score=58.37 TRINITY_DN1896_c0_g1_i1:21-671(-)